MLSKHLSLISCRKLLIKLGLYSKYARDDVVKARTIIENEKITDKNIEDTSREIRRILLEADVNIAVIIPTI